MIVEYIRYALHPEETEAFEAAYGRAQRWLRASPHCSSWDLARGVEEPLHYILRITWDSLEGHLEGFRKSAEFQGFLGEVRPYIAQIAEMRHYAVTSVASGGSVYADAGGAAAFFCIARDMHARMATDPVLGRQFAHAAESHVPHLGMWLVEVFGGPPLYSETLGDIGPMLRRHADRSITEEERARFVAIAKGVVSQHVAHAEAAEVIGRYFEWGSGVAVQNSQPGHAPDPGAGVPQWDWTSTG